MRKVIIILGFILGLLFCINYSSKDLVEGLEGFNVDSDCPDILVKKGNRLELLNTKKAKIPGENPKYFDNLEEYLEYLEWQRSFDIKCPVLYFEESMDAQGNQGYRMTPDLIEKGGGMPSKISHQAQETKLYDAGHDNPPFNNNMYAGFDGDDQNIGVYTPLDKLFHSGKSPSLFATDASWGGLKYQQDKMGLDGQSKADRRKVFNQRVRERQLEDDVMAEHAGARYGDVGRASR